MAKLTAPRPQTLSTLESGESPLERLRQRLSRAEFERRYALLPDRIKVELIEGIVYVVAPLRYRRHSRPRSLIMGWLGNYEAGTPGVESANNTTLRLDEENEPEPDAILRVTEENGGRSRVSEDDYLEGAPELIVEIASSSASYDLHDKLKAYQRNEVREYLVWLVEEKAFRWYVLTEGIYQQQKSEGNILSSPFFPGLRLDVTALLAGDIAGVLAALKSPLSG